MLQRTRPSRSGCNPRFPRAGSVNWGRLGIMGAMSRRTRITGASVAVIGAAVTTALLWSSGNELQTPNTLRIDRQKSGSAGSGVAAQSTNIMPDFFRLKYSPALRAEFHATSRLEALAGKGNGRTEGSRFCRARIDERKIGERKYRHVTR